MRVPEGVSFASKEFVRNPSFAKLGGYPEAEVEHTAAKAVYRRARRDGADNRFDTDFEAGVRFRAADAAQPILGWTAYTIPSIHGIWAYNTFCDAWDYDPTPEKAAKYLAFGRELAAGLEHSWKVVDGVRKLDLSCSPEVGDNRSECFLNANSSYERAILNSFYVWLSRFAEACGKTEESKKWRGYVGTFGPPNATKDGTVTHVFVANPAAGSVPKLAK